MTDERRWNVYACPGDCPDRSGLWNVAPKDGVCPSCGGRVVPVVVVPVSSVVPIARLREFADAAHGNLARSRAIDREDRAYRDGILHTVHELSALLDELECASNPNNERTNNA